MEQEKTDQEKTDQEKADQLRLDEIAKRNGVAEVFEVKAYKKNKESGNIDEITAVFRKPSRSVISASMSQQNRNPLGAKETILRSCFLEGDKRILDDDDFFLSACTVVDEMIEIRMADLKKN
jgi:hypothetical protein